MKLYSCSYGLLPEREHGFQLALLVSGINLGGFLGSVVVTRFSQRIHPLIMLFIGSVFTLCAITGVIYSEYWLSFVSRLFWGCGVGIISVICPSFAVRNSPLPYRGAIGGLFQVSIASGIALSAVVSYFLLREGRDLRIDEYCHFVGTTGASTNVIQLIFISLLLPCSAALALGFIALKQFPGLRFIGDRELTGSSLRVDLHRHDCSIMEDSSFFWRLGKARKAVVISVMAAVALQLTGINAVMYYTYVFLDAAGVERQSLGTIFIMLVNFSATLIPLGTADLIGRKPLLIGGLISMTISMLMLCFMSNFIVSSMSAGRSIIGFSILSLYIYGFGIGPGFHFWVICNEVLPWFIYQEGFALVNTIQWMFLIIVTSLFPQLQHVLGSYVFLIFSSLGLVSLIFFYFFLPETRGLSKEHIEDILGTKI